MRQIPVLAPNQLQKPTPWKGEGSCASWIRSRALKLHPFSESGVENSQALQAHDKFELQAELHAAMFHLYGIQRDDVDYIMETFPIVKKKDLKEFGTYRTKERILEIFDEMATAIEHCDAPSGSIDFREGNK